ncbi:hypothetical protein QBC42DRAFT_153280, partial [Cladorrhinum samala]
VPSEAPEEDSFAFGIEKGFWRVEHGARELLRFAKIYHQHRDTLADGNRAGVESLPKEIDLISMTQLSYGVLHAVSDLRAHSQRAMHHHALISNDNRVAKRQRQTRSRKRKTMATEISCAECFCTSTPQWRNDSAGRTLCNVCGLIQAKRCQMYGSGYVSRS